jgi:hypothetical protein
MTHAHTRAAKLFADISALARELSFSDKLALAQAKGDFSKLPQHLQDKIATLVSAL